jgi:apolipoprotein N-acyltransferase
VRSTNLGVTSFVDPSGRVVAERSGPAPGLLQIEAPLLELVPLAARGGREVTSIAAAIALALAAAGPLASRRLARRGAAAPTLRPS